MVTPSGFRLLGYLYGSVHCTGSLMMIITSCQMMQRDHDGYHVGSTLYALSLISLIIDLSLLYGIWKSLAKLLQVHLIYNCATHGLVLALLFAASVTFGAVATEHMRNENFFAWIGITALFFVLMTFTTVCLTLTWWILKGIQKEINSTENEAVAV